MMYRVIKWLVKNEVLVLVVAGVVLLRVPSLFEPYWNAGEIKLLLLLGNIDLFWYKLVSMIIAVVVVLVVWFAARKRMLAVGMVAMLVATPILTMSGNAVRIGEYYINFGQWITGHKDKTAYFAWFGEQTTRTYEIARAVAAGNETDKVLVWPDNPAVYALANKKRGNNVTQDKPEHVVVDKKETGADRIIQDLNGEYILEKEWCGIRVFRRMGYN